MAAPEWASLRRWGGNDCLGKSLSRMFTFLELQAKSAGADNLGEDANLDLRQTLQQLFIWHSTEGRRVFRLVNPANTGDEGTLFVVVHEMRAAPCSRDPNEPDEPVLLCSYVSNDWSVTNLSTVRCSVVSTTVGKPPVHRRRRDKKLLTDSGDCESCVMYLVLQIAYYMLTWLSAGPCASTSRMKIQWLQ